MTPQQRIENKYVKALLSIFDWAHQAYLNFLEPQLPSIARQDAKFAHTTELKLLFATLRVALKSRVIHAFNEIAGELDEDSAKAVGELLGIDPRSISAVAHLLDHFRDENVRLVTNATQDFANQIEDMLSRGSGLRVEELRAQIQERVDVSRSRAELIARDQVLKMNGQINKTRQQAAGVTEYEWSTSLDERVREGHSALEGRRFSWDNPPVVDEKGRREHPGQDFQCRCIAIPVIPETEIE